MFKILILLCFSLAAFGQAKFQPDDLRLKPKATTARPAGVEGQLFADKTTNKLYYYNGTSWFDMLLASALSDTAYDATTWNGVTTVAPSKNAVRDILETMIADTALKAPLASPTFTGTITTPLTASRAVVTGASSQLAVSATTATELGYVSGVTSAIQTQLGTKITNPMTTLGDWLYGGASGSPTRLAGNITTSMKAFTQTGDGANSAAPVWTTVTSTNTASSIMARDSSGDFVSRNATVNTINTGYTTTATAAGTTTLTVASTQQQFFSGVTTQTVVLPVVTTLVNGQIYRIVNLSTGSVTVQSSGANTIQVMTTQTELVVTVRDSTAGTGTTSWTARYNSLAGAAGGGGGSLQWIEVSGNSPMVAIENNNKVYKFQSGLGQALQSAVRVPSSYVAGNQVNLKLTYYTPDQTGTGLLTCVSTLIRTGTDAISSTTNQRTSTNAAVTFSVQDRLLSLTCDLSSSTGQINSTAIAAGDLVLVSLTRGTDTATSDIRALVYGTEVTFQWIFIVFLTPIWRTRRRAA